MLFPFYDLENHHNWVNDLEDFLLQENHLDLRRVIEYKLRYIYDGFEIPFVTLGADRSLEQVTEIFEKINSRGFGPFI